MNYFICLLLIVVSFTACKEQPPKETATELEIEKDNELEYLLSMMTGSFSSERQATLDTNFRDVTLHMYPIWPEKDGKWLYVEQALTNNQEEPYRQRIYKLSRENDSTLRSDIYTIPNASLWACKWQTPKFFDRLLHETIEMKEGCEMLLKITAENTFKGKTVDKNCANELNGAVYATSEVIISEKQIISWDRGFDENDSIVWGPKYEGYEFDKLWED